MAMVEALACGTPVVGCPQGAAPEIVEHGVTGYLSNDDDALAVALGQVAQIDRRACRQRVATLFSVEQMVEGYLRVYELQRQRQGHVPRQP